MCHLLHVGKHRALLVVEQLGALPGRDLGDLLAAIATHLHHRRVLVELVIRPDYLCGPEDGELAQTARRRCVETDRESHGLRGLGELRRMALSEREIDDSAAHGVALVETLLQDRIEGLWQRWETGHFLLLLGGRYGAGKQHTQQH